MKVGWTPAALGDLRGIGEWLTGQATADIALDVLGKIRTRADFLGDFPHGGRPHRDGARILRVFGTRYLIRYRIVAERVEVLRVHHEREDWHVGS